MSAIETLKAHSVAELLTAAQEKVEQRTKADDEDKLIAGEIEDIRRRYAGKYPLDR